MRRGGSSGLALININWGARFESNFSKQKILFKKNLRYNQDLEKKTRFINGATVQLDEFNCICCMALEGTNNN